MAALAAVVAAPVAALKIIEQHPWKKVGTSGRYQVDPMWGGKPNPDVYGHEWRVRINTEVPPGNYSIDLANPPSWVTVDPPVPDYVRGQIFNLEVL